MSNLCQTGWIQYRSNCYNFNIQSLTWSDCKTLCDSLKSSMLCITDSATNSWVANQIGSSTPAWIGLSDSPEQNGNYRWVAGCASTYTNWGNGEPNNLGTESWVGGFVNGQYWYNSNASSGVCSCQYSVAPTSSPTEAPSNPSSAPSVKPTTTPTIVKSYPPTLVPTNTPTQPTVVPTTTPPTYDYDDSSGSSSDSTGSTVGIIFAVICFCLCAGGAAKKRELVLVGYAPVYAERDV